MARFPYDETWIREPNLLVPGKKPIGSVRIDTQNSLTRNLQSAWLFNANSQRDIVGHYQLTTLGTGGTKEIIEGEPCISSVNSITNGYKFDHDLFIAPPFTLLMKVRMSSFYANGVEDTVLDVFGSSDCGNDCAAGIFTIFAENDTDGNGNGLSVGYDGHRLISATTALSTDTWYTACFVQPTSDTDSLEIWINGNAESVTAVGGSNKTIVEDQGGPAGLGMQLVNLGPQYPMAASISYFYGWDRALSDGEIISVSRDPHQILA